GRLVIAAAIHRQRHAPDLLALLAAQIVEILDEAGDQIGLGEEDIDREADAELIAELAQPLAYGARMRQALAARQPDDIGDADGDKRAVDRLARAEFLEQAEETLPSRLVGRGVAVLCRVAAGGIEQHRLVGEPPVAVARAADALDRILAVFRRERKVESGIL